MPKADNLTAEMLRSFLDYNPVTGGFIHKTNSRHGRAGKSAGCIGPQGYIQIGVCKKNYLAHRLAWLYVHGRWPENVLDHKDGNKSNNRLENLREATQSQNLYNAKTPKRNLSGRKGITWDKGKNKWMARIVVSRQSKFLGRFATIEQAIEARLAAEILYHGEFARAA